MSYLRKLLRVTVFAAVIVIACAVGLTAWWLNQPLGLAADSVELSVEQGISPREIAQAWVQAGVQSSPWLLFEWFRWSGDARKIRAGRTKSTVTPRPGSC